jgi:hypothetical protein
MAINRALMNRQMYNMGGPSLQAGAPDITLTGDMRPTYSAMRKQRLAYGGIAGLDGRKKYGIGSWFQENIMDPIKENPVTSAVIGGGLLNQFGLPGSQYIGLDENFGQNFLGDLINKDLVIGPGGEQFDFPFESTIGNLGEEGGLTPEIAKLVFGMPGTGTDQGVQVGNMGGENVVSQISKAYEAATNPSEKSFFSNLLGNVTSSITGALTGDSDQAKLAKALAAGAAAGAYVDSQPKDTIPADTTGLDIPAIAQAARGTDAQGAAAGLRFLPDQVTRAANGGRIGYQNAGTVQPKINRGQVEMLIKKGADNELIKTYSEGILDEDINKIRKEVQDIMRNNKAEGGLMNLGGMEKDYREEGGFVPIGGKEKADDVPARLSKNEFVFTADAVRNAGGGDIDQGAQVMEKLMRNLESGGQVSEESQGLDGAREMFETSQRLEKRII